MAIREGFNEFLKNFDKFDDWVLLEALRDFNDVAHNVLSDAQDVVAVASGNLRKTGVILKAKETKTGIKSSVIYKADYAKNLHDNPNIKFKPVGEVSYSDGGQTFTKSQQGTHEWLRGAMLLNEPFLMEAIKKSIERAWDRV